MNQNWSVILCFLLFAYIIFQQQCGTDKTSPVRDTIRYETQLQPIYLPSAVSPPIVIHQPLPARVDTVFVVRDYYDKRTYTDSVSNDTITINVQEVIEQNRLASRSVSYLIKKPFVTILPKPEQKNQIYIGAYANSDAGLGGLVTLKTKRDVLYGIGYDPIHKTLQLQAQFKLKLWQN